MIFNWTYVEWCLGYNFQLWSNDDSWTYELWNLWIYAYFCEVIINDLRIFLKWKINAIVKGLSHAIMMIIVKGISHICIYIDEMISHLCWILSKELFYVLMLKNVNWYWLLSSLCLIDI